MVNTRSEETGVKPTKEDRKKFDIDLEYGQIREDRVADIFTKAKIEVKSERGMWMQTGNIAIEYESYGKPSGSKQPNQTIGFTIYVLMMKNIVL